MTWEPFDRTPPAGPPDPPDPMPPRSPLPMPEETPPPEETLDSGHPDEPTMAEAIDERLQRASDVTRDAIADGSLAIVGIALAVLSFMLGQAGTSLAYLRINEVDYAHIVNEDVLGAAGIMAAVGAVAAIAALALGRGALRTWRKDVAVAALILGLLSAGLHGTIWGMSIQHHAPDRTSNFAP